MSKRVWACVLAILLAAAAVAIWTVNSGSQPLHSEHAQPAHIGIDDTVWVSADGNLFHAASCKDLHHPAQSMPASEAIAKGYAPCTRCMRKAIGK